MAIFNEMNKRSGLVVGTVVVALALFLLTDLFFGKNSIFSKSDNKIGEIAGEKIKIDAYRQQIQIAEQNFMMQTNHAVSEEDRPSIRQNAWNQMIFDIAYKEQFEKLGITVTDEEWLDLAEGDFIHPMVKQLFGDPKNFSKEMVANFLANLSKYPQQDQALWYYVDTKLPEVRLREKYSNLFKKTEYVTSAEAKRAYIDQTAKASGQFLQVPLFSIPDSSITITDAELEAYLKEHAPDYQVEEGRSLDYVVFAVAPSTEDTASMQEELAQLKTNFAETENDTLFVQYNSDQVVPVAYKRMGQLPEGINIDLSDSNKVYGPYFENGTYHLYKVLGEKEDTLYSVRASHILFKPAGNTPEAKAKAKKDAEKVLAEIKAGANFKEEAEKYGTDATALKGGDLGWFTEGQMVKPFDDAVFQTNKIGLIPHLVESRFGYHIIKITASKVKKEYKVAEVNRILNYSEDTKDRVYQKVMAFASVIKDTAQFYAKAKKEDLEVQHAENITKTDYNLGTLKGAREIIRWAYKDAEQGDISPVTTVNDKFVVALLKDVREKGLADLDEVRDDVTKKVRQEKKAKQVIAKLNKINADSLKAIASQFGGAASTGQAENVTLSATYIQGLGYDPFAVGHLLGLKSQKRSAPFQGQSAVVIMEMKSFIPAPEIADYASYRTQIEQEREGRVQYQIDEAIKKEADISDMRYKFM